MSENQEAAAFVRAFQRQWPKHDGKLLHFGNETFRGTDKGAYIGALKARKARGVVTGCSDYFIAVPTDEMHGCFIELKAGNGTIKPEQVAFLQRMAEAGYGAAVAWGWVAALMVTSRYIKGILPPYVVGCPFDSDDPVALGVLTLGGKRRARGQASPPR